LRYASNMPTASANWPPFSIAMPSW
jgi:hypothetical protein